jgi:predicted RNase H-like nuclease (RuvC/YqgF family)
MIPLRVADMAVAACEAEIEKLQEENARLRSEVERLTKAGDAMASSIQFNEEMSQDYNGPTIVHQSVQRWNAVKEGKQSSR